MCPATGLSVTSTFLSASYGITKCTNCNGHIYGQAYKVTFIAETWLHVSFYNQNTFPYTHSKFRGQRDSPVTNFSRTGGTLIDAHYPITIFKRMFIFDLEPVSTCVWTETPTLTLSTYSKSLLAVLRRHYKHWTLFGFLIYHDKTGHFVLFS